MSLWVKFDVETIALADNKTKIVLFMYLCCFMRPQVEIKYKYHFLHVINHYMFYVDQSIQNIEKCTIYGNLYSWAKLDSPLDKLKLF